jgi:hypothetical protein
MAKEQFWRKKWCVWITYICLQQGYGPASVDEQYS